MAKFTVDQRVEHHAYDFSQPTHPIVWFPSTIIAIDEEFDTARRLVQISFRHDGETRIIHEIVGPRGGNRKIRPATAEAAR